MFLQLHTTPVHKKNYTKHQKISFVISVHYISHIYSASIRRVNGIINRTTQDEALTILHLTQVHV